MRLSELLHREVETESGRRLGHVHDVRAERRGDTLVISGLILGRRALLEHFGIARAHPKLRTTAPTVTWQAVIRISSGKVIVENGTEVPRAKAPCRPDSST